jgi:hypothetical protein
MHSTFHAGKARSAGPFCRQNETGLHVDFKRGFRFAHTMAFMPRLRLRLRGGGGGHLHAFVMLVVLRQRRAGE